ncbi:MAG: hypothetical protein COC10_13305 [Sphingobium sp.]|nr:MAG: hypothetical protein COC10_13305 [Sphingobium sp.]
MPGIADQRRGYPGFGGSDASRGLWQAQAGGRRAVQDGDHHGQGFGDEIHHSVDVGRQLFANLGIGQGVESVQREDQPGDRLVTTNDARGPAIIFGVNWPLIERGSARGLCNAISAHANPMDRWHL